MAPTPEQVEMVSPLPDNSGEGSAPPQCAVSQDSLFWRQVRVAGLETVAQKVSAGGDLELSEAIALSRASLPLLGKLVELRSAASGSAAAVSGAWPIARVASLPESPKNIGQFLTDWESFCRRLIATRDERLSIGAVGTWNPILGSLLDRELGGDGDFTGVDVLRAIALARLVLPAAVEVCAPLATLGPKLAQVALQFGASHLGYVAPDGQTPSHPLVADPDLLNELVRSCGQTTLKEEPK